MSYQVLARKWRPGRFADVVGQEHAVRSLAHALDHDRMHHALLFTGTRGVGKTTIARILAKALNCEQGTGSEPCGTCANCVAVDEGRFIDLIEIDAASRTKVEDTRELLENVQYAPTRGRCKVYLIDEVHMLSRHSFNALLKTLEEPPEHVQFLLATTDPQQLPVTVLSRCLQFNLKRLDPGQVGGQLTRILEAEGIGFEAEAITLLARAADGSMRDGLSLLDQAIAHGGGQVTAAAIRQMLGTIELRYIQALVAALLAGDADALYAAIDDAADRSPDFEAVLNDLLTTLYHLSLVQQAPQIISQRNLDGEWLEHTAGQADAETLQLYYQIALLGKRDLQFAPDSRTGFEMAMLRMLAFRPQSEAPGQSAPSGGGEPATTAKPPAKVTANPAQPEVDVQPENGVAEARGAAEAASATTDEPLSRRWIDLVEHLGLVGLNHQVALNAAPEQWDATRLELVLDRSHEAIFTREREQVLRNALHAALGQAIEIRLRIDSPANETPAQRAIRLKQERQHAAEESIHEDPVVEELVNAFGSSTAVTSIQPVNKPRGTEHK